ncbi:TPA: hypothetical protein ACMFQU_006484 [Pseudomonas aeruginosa]|nr:MULTISPECIES: hypothetical protein [Pseudomonas]EKF3302896.1 hypothetical protein [Pseudomonas aeruginosa]EKU7693827.1 hypothetical protein [Pseudomonas aeruginosa]EKU7703772.1 hypothetical protein [Pseudomonas aeruginosa]EKU8046654.1 hypothetical protein [Pseudomonas aeruginosa]EKV0189046.1 hypothetical protein [Pseudomonas aeruginosa]
MIEMKPEAWKITGSRTWCDKVVEIEDRADRSIQERDDGSFKVPLYAIHAGHVVVPRELLEELLEAAKDGAAHKGEYLSKKYGEPELFAKFDTLLQS